MNWHPLTLTLLLLTAVGLVIYLFAAVRMFFLLPHWQAAGDDAAQLLREREMEVIDVQGRWAMLLLAVAMVLLVFGISNVWPALVPGAMCGTGVMEALGPDGWRALIFLAGALLMLYLWRSTAKVEGRYPLSVAAPFQGRLFLLAVPFWVSGAWYLWRAQSALTEVRVVNCCAVVYHQAMGTGFMVGVWDSNIWLVLGLAAGLTAVGWGAGLRQRSATPSGWRRLWPVLVIWVGLPAAYAIITRMTAPYVLEVLHHPCPWCLMLFDHGLIGAFLFGLPLWVAAEGLVALVIIVLGRRYPQLDAIPAPGRRSSVAVRLRRAGNRMIIGTLLFILAATAPAVWWYRQFGDWIGR